MFLARHADGLTVTITVRLSTALALALVQLLVSAALHWLP
jgi:hypothetical protein